ncbi:MAG: hypothetical protein ABIV51_09140, partial [Saprospiraceae bacterium]
GYVAYGATNSTDSQKFLFRLVDYKILTYYTESSFAADRPSKIAEIVKLTDSELIIFEKELNIDLATQQTIFTGRVNIYFFEK